VYIAQVHILPRSKEIAKQKTYYLALLLLPTIAQRCRSETETFILEDLFNSVLLQFKKYHSSGNLKFNNLGIFQS